MCSKVTQNEALVTANLVSLAYIERVPNEILRHIMSFLLTWQTAFETKHGIVRMPTIMTLRPVSRRFRRMMVETDFWRDDDFDFCEPFDEIDDPGNLIKTAYITNLFRDEHLTGVLKHKSEWKFKQLEPFLAALQSFPGLSQAARQINFYKFHFGIRVVLKLLPTFSNLTGLQLDLRYLVDYPCSTIGEDENTDCIRRNGFDLDLIAQSCPCVEELALKGLREHVGTLSQLGNLRFLVIEFSYERDIALTSSILPFKSIPTLTLLKLRAYDHISEDFDLDIINSFVDVTSLELTTFLPEVCHFLTQSTLKLESFTSGISTEYTTTRVAQMVKALTAPCLKSLLRLSISFRPEWSFDGDANMVEPIFVAITNIETLNRLRLKIGMKVSWCERFAMLTSLNNLHLFPLFVELENNDTIKNSDDPDDPIRGERMLPRDAKDKIQNALDGVFAGFDCKPRVTVWTVHSRHVELAD